MATTAVDFAATARALAAEARRLGLAVPGFRSPPRLAGIDRSLRRRRGGVATVAVRRAGRPFDAVVADMVEGVVRANHLTGTEAERCRAALALAVGPRRPSAAAA